MRAFVLPALPSSRRVRAAFAICALSVAMAAAHAQPGPRRGPPPSPDPDEIAGQAREDAMGASPAGLRSFTVPGANGDYAYEVQVAVPAGDAPAAGWPVIYLVDGNAVRRALTEAHAAGAPDVQAVTVTVGYAGVEEYHGARADDYLPPLGDWPAVVEPRQQGHAGGGADRFLDTLATRIRPRVEAMAKIDPRRQGIYGHSYGGVLVLHTLFTRPAMFQRYVAASPSLWWQNGFLFEEARRFAASGDRPAGLEVLLMVGGLERRRGEPPPAPDAPPPVPHAQRLAEQLATLPGVTASYRFMADKGHGPMLRASLGPALRFVQR